MERDSSADVRPAQRFNPAGRRILLWLFMALGACVVPPDVGLPPFGPSPSGGGPPTATLPPEPKTLVVCVAEEPASLYLYADAGQSANVILEAIFDGPIDSNGYSFQSVLLEKLPSLADGDARLESVAVGGGDVYFNPETRRPENLRPGAPYLPEGCAGGTCVKEYAGGRVRMDQLVVEFRLISDVRWADGEPVRASDSVFSFRLDADSETPSTKYLVDRTYAYEAVDERTTRWTGIPGLRDAMYASNFWSPMPEHALQGISAGDLLTSDAAQAPLGWGPYRIEEWLSGRQVRLRANPEYWRRSQGLPRFEVLVIRFLGAEASSGLDQLPTEECDILDETILELIPLAEIRQATGDPDLSLSLSTGAMERLDFVLSPSAEGRPTLLTDVRTRRGLALCVNRPRIVDEILFGLSPVPSGYLPADHPDFREAAEPIAYDPEAGRALLEEAGWWLDEDPSAVRRRARSVGGVEDGTELGLRLAIADDDLHLALADRLRQDLGACGVGLEAAAFPFAALLAPWPDGPAFSGDFDMVSWAWPVLHTPGCEMFATWEIPSEMNPLGVNATGWSDRDYDRACTEILNGLREEEGYGEAVALGQELFSAELPGLALFLHPRLVASRAEICGLQADPTGLTALSGIEAIGRGPDCGPPDG